MSGFGRCALTVAIPVLSAMGFQVCPVPTAVLSCHTAYSDFAIQDLTDFMPKCLEKWKKLNFEFECIYSGFLASHRQVGEVNKYIDAYPEAIIVVDPVMGDEGEIYKTVDEELKNSMIELVQKADLITPNLTEAAVLLKEKYPENGISIPKVKEWLSRLAELGPQYVVITGVKTDSGKYLNAGFDKMEGKYYGRYIDYVPKVFYGTGDIFASVMTGCILEGMTLKYAMAKAVRYIEMCIDATTADGDELKDGVYFESKLDFLSNGKRLKELTEL